MTDNGGKSRVWPDKYEVIRSNYDIGEGPYSGKPGGGEKSMRDFIDKKRKLTKQIANDTGKFVEAIRYICNVFEKKATGK